MTHFLKKSKKHVNVYFRPYLKYGTNFSYKRVDGVLGIRIRDRLDMELFSRRRRRLDRPKQKAVVLNPKNYATRAWHNSILV